LKFVPMRLPGAHLVEPQQITDDRGFFARIYCREEFEAYGLNTAVAQCSISFNERVGTLRGMHYQRQPCAEAKLVRCTNGAIYDVILDLRPESPTFKRWEGVELSAKNRRAVYVPEGFAHGFLTLTEGAEVFYQISEAFHAEYSVGVRWNDPAFGIVWPATIAVISERDRTYSDFGA